MEKTNVFKSNSFYLYAGDVVHMTITTTGVAITIQLVESDGTAINGVVVAGGQTFTAATSDTHHFEFGLDASATSTLNIQMYITRTGKRSVDWLQALSLGYMSFMGGNLYLHNDDSADRCTFFGERQDFKVGVVINEMGDVTKILDSIALLTDGVWEVESITIPADQNYPDGMYSKIPSGKFVKREGKLHAEFMRNMYTKGGTVNYLQGVVGEPLRGRQAYVVLKNTSTAKVSLWGIEVNMTKSR